MLPPCRAYSKCFPRVRVLGAFLGVLMMITLRLFSWHDEGHIGLVDPLVLFQLLPSLAALAVPMSFWSQPW